MAPVGRPLGARPPRQSGAPAAVRRGGCDLEVGPGSVFALLGPNGAGKTTTVRILATLIRPDSGTARVAGFDVTTQPHDVRRRISLTGQDAALDEAQTGAENLTMTGRLRHLDPRAARPRAGELLEQLDLVDAGRRRVATYSGGMRRRLDLAASLVTRPEVLFLDEPTTGLDPRSRQAVWEIVTGLAATGVTVLLTTRYLDEADVLGDRIAVLDAGRVVAEGTAAELKEHVAGHRLDVVLSPHADVGTVLGLLGDLVVQVDHAARTVGIATDGRAGDVRALLDRIDPGGGGVASSTVHTATLDDVFLALTGRAGTPAGASAREASRV